MMSPYCYLLREETDAPSAVPRRPCRQLPETRAPQGGAREIRRRRACGRGSARRRGRLHPRGRQRRGECRPQGGHRRRVPPHLFPCRFPRAPRGRRDPLRRICFELPQDRRNAGRLQAADHACRQPGQMGRADPGAGLRLLEVGRDADAEGLNSSAVDAAFPRRPRGDQRGGLSEDRGFLRGPDRRLPRRDRRPRRPRLPLPPVRRHQPRLSLRPRDPRAHQGARRRSGRADPPLCGLVNDAIATARPT